MAVIPTQGQLLRNGTYPRFMTDGNLWQERQRELWEEMQGATGASLIGGGIKCYSYCFSFSKTPSIT